MREVFVVKVFVSKVIVVRGTARVFSKPIGIVMRRRSITPPEITGIVSLLSHRMSISKSATHQTGYVGMPSVGRRHVGTRWHAGGIP